MAGESHELLKMSRISEKHENQLRDYVKDNQRVAIRNLLARVENLVNKEHGYPYYKPILYIACEDFAAHVSPSTVTVLIENGAKLYQDTSSKEALHFAVRGMNPDILQLVIQYGKERINATADGDTALYTLIDMGNKVYEMNDGDKVNKINKIKTRNKENFEKCLDLLLKSGLDVNISNDNGYTPILLAAYRGYKNVVTAIINCRRSVDIDNHKLDGKSAREYIEEKKLYDGTLPPKRDINQNKEDLAVAYIKELREDDFLNLENLDVNHETEEYTILQQACDNNLVKVVRKLLERGADVNKLTTKNKETPLEITARKGYYEIFKLLLNKYKQLPSNIVVLLLSNMRRSVHEHINHEECLKILFNDRKEALPVNEYSDTGNTPIHYASGFADAKLTLKLLERGASLANRNKFNYLAVEDINPQALEKHFNTCVRLKNQLINDKQSIKVTFDYTSLIPTSKIKVKDGDLEKEEKEDVESTKFMEDKVYKYSQRETDVVHAMSKNPDMRKLLVHPLIASFIFIKWHRMRWFFRANVLLFAMFCISLITYVLIPNDHNERDVSVLKSILILTYFLIIFKEVLQMLFSIKRYFRSPSNILEILMLIVCSYIIFYKSTDILYRELSSVAMILLALETMVLLGQHPRLSTNIVMFRTVTKNFFLFLLWYAVLLLAFVLCFHILFNTNGNKSNSIDNSNSTNFFNEPGLTFIKTIVMLTGEFDATSINFNSRINILIFLAFVFLISIILINLLNGLAVSDTQTIQKEAEIIGYIERINYVSYLENVMLGNTLSTKINSIFQKFLSPISNCLLQRICLVPYYLKECKMDVYLYRNGEIVKGENSENSENCFSFCRKACIDRNTINRVKDLLHDQQNTLKEMQVIMDDLEEVKRCQQEILKYLRFEQNNSRRGIDNGTPPYSKDTIASNVSHQSRD